MPAPGIPNNPAGINAFSGPMGQKEPAYGQVERLKQLTAAAPPGTPGAVNAPKRAQRRATKRKSGVPAAGAVTAPPAAAPQPSPIALFWQEIAADPEASPLVRQYAAEVGNG